MSDSRTGKKLRRRAIGLVYFAGFLQGITLVSFPASGSVFKQLHGFSDAQYGAIFLPQVALALVGALLGAAAARRVGLKRLLWIALLGITVSQLLLGVSAWVAPAWRYALVLGGTAFMGFGFGLAGAPLNGYPPLFFPRQRDSAVVALHTLLGLGLAMGPLLIGVFTMADLWAMFPFMLAGICLAAALTAMLLPLPSGAEDEVDAGPARDRPLTSVSFWSFAAAAVLYAFAEGTFSNWIVIYLSEAKGLAMDVATLALSVFWGALVVGRLVVSALVLRVGPESIWITLPLVMIAAFLLLPLANGATFGVALFALAGLACSAFFPLTITLAARHFPHHVAWVSSMMIAALMLGVGIGSFVVGPLRGWLTFENLYRLSALYPAAVLGIATSLVIAGAKRRAVAD
jgi:fucose permease